MGEGNVRFDGPVERPRGRLILAHGAGAGMDSEFMQQLAQLLAGQRLRVARFEFPYMQKRREDGKRRPPDRAPVLLEYWRQIWAQVNEREPGRWAVGGKSMGGRMASLIADELGAAGLVCLGYPFHPPGKQDNLRIEHLQQPGVAGLILQGEKDAFGKREEVEAYGLHSRIQLHWLAGGNHDLKPAKASGFSQQEHMQTAARLIAGFLQQQQG